MAKRPDPPSPPVVGGIPDNHSGRDNHPVTRVVVHSAVMPCEPGRARQLGAMNRAGSTGGSWHYATDPAETIQCSWDSFVCWHAPPNSHSIGIEMADWPKPVPQTKLLRLQAIRVWRWLGSNHRRMLQRTADLTGHLCAAYGLPPRYLGWRELRANPRAQGWTTHRQVSLAFGQSSHWDPGLWPRRRFAKMVRAKHAELTGE